MKLSEAHDIHLTLENLSGHQKLTLPLHLLLKTLSRVTIQSRAKAKPGDTEADIVVGTEPQLALFGQLATLLLHWKNYAPDFETAAYERLVAFGADFVPILANRIINRPVSLKDKLGFVAPFDDLRAIMESEPERPSYASRDRRLSISPMSSIRENDGPDEYKGDYADCFDFPKHRISIFHLLVIFSDAPEEELSDLLQENIQHLSLANRGSTIPLEHFATMWADDSALRAVLQNIEVFQLNALRQNAIHLGYLYPAAFLGNCIDVLVDGAQDSELLCTDQTGRSFLEYEIQWSDGTRRELLDIYRRNTTLLFGTDPESSLSHADRLLQAGNYKQLGILLSVIDSPPRFRVGPTMPVSIHGLRTAVKLGDLNLVRAYTATNRYATLDLQGILLSLLEKHSKTEESELELPCEAMIDHFASTIGMLWLKPPVVKEGTIERVLRRDDSAVTFLLFERYGSMIVLHTNVKALIESGARNNCYRSLEAIFTHSLASKDCRMHGQVSQALSLIRVPFKSHTIDIISLAFIKGKTALVSKMREHAQDYNIKNLDMPSSMLVNPTLSSLFKPATALGEKVKTFLPQHKARRQKRPQLATLDGRDRPPFTPDIESVEAMASVYLRGLKI